jgi:hypothetical protein
MGEKIALGLEVELLRVVVFFVPLTFQLLVVATKAYRQTVQKSNQWVGSCVANNFDSF